MTIVQIKREFLDGDMSYLDAIEELERAGLSSLDAEEAVSEWEDGINDR